MTGRGELAEYLRGLAAETAAIKKRTATLENHLLAIAEKLDPTNRDKERRNA